MACRSLRSAPAQNARGPDALSTMARTVPSTARSAQTPASRPAMAVSSALSASGRSSTTSATARVPASSRRTLTPSMVSALPSSWSALSRQPLLLVLDQLEQRGLYLLHVRYLGQHQLALLARGLHR